MNLNQYPDVLTLHECQQILQVSRGTMLRLLHENEIPAFRVGNRWRIQRKAMLEFIELEQFRPSKTDRTAENALVLADLKFHGI